MAMIEKTGGARMRDEAERVDPELELSNRCLVYALLSRAFGKEPDDGLYRLLASDHVGQVFVLYGERCSWAQEVSEALADLREGTSDPLCASDAEGSGLPGCAADRLSRLQSDYTYLFLGPGKLPAPLWESVYVTGRNEVYTEETLAVRRAYREHGFSTEGFPFVADDHIAVELACMAALAQSALDAFERIEQGGETAGDAGRRAAFEASKREEGKRFARAIEAQRSFLNDHLNRWVLPFAEKMIAQEVTGPLYPSLAAFAAQFCHADFRAMQAIELKTA